MATVQQGGAIAVKVEGEEPQFLIVTARKDPTHWVFPKSELQAGEEPEDAAIRELAECGVEGEFSGRIGEASFLAAGHEVAVTYFLIRAVAEGESTTGRQLKWLGYEGARDTLSFDDARDLLDRAAKAISAR